MAKKKGGAIDFSSYKPKQRRKRPGIHAKSKISKLKGSKNYKKRYVGQGK